MKLSTAILCFGPLLIACDLSCRVPSPVPPQPDADAAAVDAPTGSIACLVACTTMQQNGCREGSDPFCPATLTKIESERLIVPAACPPGPDGEPTTGCSMTCAWCAKASTPAEVVAQCGSSCLP